ncbi:DUF58 domain-containing protein [Halomonas marinisediminis]|uniref:DUF58 domain-containing protein n=1 Tax=Halomonas marinisediminis TaxID=2546095 RepID=UPI0014046673|nr:DUF58 domain-containing protein [Halomonas marinisediminis]
MLTRSAGRRWWRRMAIAPGMALPQRRLFLLPTRFGVGWAVLVLLLLLLGINYQNSLAYALSFWLFAVASVALLRTWRNLLGVRATLRLPAETFAGDEVRLGVVLEGGRPRHAIEVHAAGGRVTEESARAGSTTLDLATGRGEATLRLPACPRGEQRLPLLRLESAWPLGLVRAVAWLASDEALLVYPRPRGEEINEHRHAGPGLESGDFAGLRRAVPGDSPARLAWKQWSRTGVLTAKVFSTPPRQQLWLDYDGCRGDLETRLSTLCARVLTHHQAGDRFGLRLPGVTLAQGEGASQRRQALTALARFRSGSNPGGTP